ncbi:protein C10-like isoform X2 [Maniola jurtina]|uniref:protein C10-like isoform X2 n=1 Tax=Aphantopus hyperantus TaxID=2795564 RepID=UPI001568B23B|nr:protein C10-like isoform X2 [Maniola hyperantus]XP_034830706.1 protein C10-like isoform X2 [Maniola hyperantus]XP_045772003.1 protein C10-like isoform X2 [Maniola jurtina]XP_045772004.1 protein C10-like isoform X2 [Maniola jurtina]
MASAPNVSVDQVRTILNEVIDSLESPDYAAKLDEAKEAAGNEMLKMMQLVFPMVVQIEMEAIKRHGFNGAREGIVQFTQLVREMESQDSEVARLHNQIRSHYLPPVSISSTVDTSL